MDKACCGLWDREFVHVAKSFRDKQERATRFGQHAPPVQSHEQAVTMK